MIKINVLIKNLFHKIFIDFPSASAFVAAVDVPNVVDVGGGAAVGKSVPRSLQHGGFDAVGRTGEDVAAAAARKVGP